MSDRKNYWDSTYFEYWKNRVAEANNDSLSASRLVAGDVQLPSDEIYVEAIRNLGVESHHRVIEIGCGFGRSLPFLTSISSFVYAIDISDAMISAAKEHCLDIRNIRFFVSDAEKINLPDCSVDMVSCFAVFDALFQSQALVEMNRLLKKEGKLLVTGKNSRYELTDEVALRAEIAARGKGHPNYFTDVSVLCENLQNFGFKVVSQKFYRRRGDFALKHYSSEKPDRFYEYQLILKKVDSAAVDASDLKISAPLSEVFESVCLLGEKA